MVATATDHAVQDRRATHAKLPMTKRRLKVLNVEVDTTDAGSTSSDAESGRCSSTAEVSPAQMDLLWPDKPLPPGQIQRGQDLPPRCSLLPGQVFRNKGPMDNPGSIPCMVSTPDSAQSSSPTESLEAVSRKGRGQPAIPGSVPSIPTKRGDPARQRRGPAQRPAPTRAELGQREEHELLERAASLRLPLKVKLPDGLPQTALDQSMPAKKRPTFFAAVDANLPILVQANTVDPLMPLKKNLTDFLLQPCFLA
ncbi:unnamed protein product [Symbiodinium natans]|uniref:Uncharacterized protein n=1 Tax=Symbiodinium natans TaxID=878477 RepID=A0A812JCM9_9DINO|nr:unnamed protein product [Symbiodinium natans]